MIEPPQRRKTPMLIPKRSLEHSSQPVISRQRFIRRMLIVIGLWLALTFIGLVVGVAGYAKFEGMSLVDAYVNAAMILSGMGPVGELKTTAGKIFAGTYASLLRSYHYHCDWLFVGPDLSPGVAPFPCRIQTHEED